MLDPVESAVATAPDRDVWLAEHRRERLARLEKENDWLRSEMQRCYRALAVVVAADIECRRRRIDRLVRVLRETAP